VISAHNQWFQDFQRLEIIAERKN